MEKGQLVYFGPHILGRFDKCMVCLQRSPNGQFEKFSTLFCTKAEVKRGSILQKNCQCMYLGFYSFTMLTVLDKWGCLLIVTNWTNFEF